MQIHHPSGPLELKARDELLQRALRPFPTAYGIQAEYPLVLAPAGVQWSFCLGTDDRVLAHANLWPRVLVSGGERVMVGLVGNVATDETVRGQGVMTRLLRELKRVAAERGLAALVLWSDLLEFYQKQGFSSQGGELRYTYSTAGLRRAGVPAGAFQATAPKGLPRERLAALLAARCPTAATLERSPEEFAAQLTIPGLGLFLPRKAGVPAYAVMGKGCDMVNVVHEWGAPDPKTALEAVLAAAEHGGYAEALLLAPGDLAPEWQAALSLHAEAVERHGMALIWENTDDASTRATLAKAFIWGLDSI